MDSDDFDCELEMTFNEVDRVLDDGLGNTDSADLEQALEKMFDLAKKFKRPIVCKFTIHPPIQVEDED